MRPCCSLHLFFFFLFTLANFVSEAQTPQLDSLKLALKTAQHDSTRCYILGLIIEAESDDAMILDHNEKLKDIALKNIRSIKDPLAEKKLIRFYKSYLSVYFNNLGYVFQNRGDVQNALDNYNKSLKLKEEVSDKSGISSTLNNIAGIYYGLGNIQKALGLFKESLKTQEEMQDSSAMAYSLNNIAFIYQNQGELPKAIEYLNKSLNVRKLIGDKKGQAVCMINLALIYLNRGDVTGALNLYSKSLQILERSGDKQALAYCINGIGIIYQDQGEYTKALDQYNKCLNMFKSINDKKGMGYALNNIGVTYQKQNKLNEALEYYFRSNRCREDVGDKNGVAECENNIGYIYKSRNKLKEASEHYSKSLKIREEISDKQGMALSMLNLGIVFAKLGENTKALQYIDNSMKIGKGLGYPKTVRDAAESLFMIHKQTGNHQLALENYELYIKMRDSLSNLETQKATIKQQTKYEYDKQKAVEDEKHAAEIKQQEEKAGADKKRQNIIIGSVSIVLLLVGVFSVVLFNRFKITQKQKAIIEIKEKETQFQKHLIEEKHREITDSINYAERIQKSFLATQKHLDENLPEYFVLFRPKDVVSGDFYWSATLNNGNFILATADSTGHGVPGAIMSLLNITSLEKAIETKNSPDEILNATRKTIIERLKKDGSEHGGKDGMDCSLISFDLKNKKLLIANANNPIWIVSGTDVQEIKADLSALTQNVIEVKADKMPVGKHDKDQESFTLKTIVVKTGDVVYTLTDGFPDQFGGEKGKKYMSKNLRELLAKNSQLPMTEQKVLLEKEFRNWVGDLEQVDDVTVIGIRI
jgi:tetratricopeptide (TPR) repeat protein